MSACRINRLSEVLAFALTPNCSGSSISNITFLNINLSRQNVYVNDIGLNSEKLK